jgi:hypothetical protein
MDSDIEASPGDLLRDFKKATEEFKLCPNRVWAVAKGKLPDLIPESIEPIPGHEQHELCTFDFYEYSQHNFIAVKQRYKCKDGKYEQLQYLFSRDTLKDAAKNGKLTI